jgi:HEAT repeat protein
LIDLADALEDGPVLAAVLLQTGKRPKLGAGSLLIDKVGSPSAEVRAAAAEALAQVRDTGAGAAILPLLGDHDARVRRAAADAVGKLEVRAAAESLSGMLRVPGKFVKVQRLILNPEDATIPCGPCVPSFCGLRRGTSTLPSSLPLHTCPLIS